MYLLERGTEYVPTADRNPRAHGGALREVNCALETTSWRLGIFQSAVDTASDAALLMPAMLVTLYDPETRSSLGLGKALKKPGKPAEERVREHDLAR